jgi:hypothetical protein
MIRDTLGGGKKSAKKVSRIIRMAPNIRGLARKHKILRNYVLINCSFAAALLEASRMNKLYLHFLYLCQLYNPNVILPR